MGVAGERAAAGHGGPGPGGLGCGGGARVVKTFPAHARERPLFRVFVAAVAKVRLIQPFRAGIAGRILPHPLPRWRRHWRPGRRTPVCEWWTTSTSSRARPPGASWRWGSGWASPARSCWTSIARRGHAFFPPCASPGSSGHGRRSHVLPGGTHRPARGRGLRRWRRASERFGWIVRAGSIRFRNSLVLSFLSRPCGTPRPLLGVRKHRPRHHFPPNGIVPA